MDLKEEDILGKDIATHWYYESKGQALTYFISNCKTETVLDVGAGSGVFSKRLLDSDLTQIATCVDPNYPRENELSHNGKVLRFVKSVSSVTQNLILMMDVLEHVDDDVTLLKTYTESMPQDSHVLITVPAFQFLWSGHDVFLEHKRRYTLPALEKTVRAAGLVPIKSRYFFGGLFLPIALLRLITGLLVKTGQLTPRSSLKKCHPVLNRILIKLHGLELRILFPHNKIIGLSVFCLCRKAP